MAEVRTTDRILIKHQGESGRPLTEEEALADAERRNEKAEKLGIQTRYVVVGAGLPQRRAK